MPRRRMHDHRRVRGRSADLFEGRSSHDGFLFPGRVLHRRALRRDAVRWACAFARHLEVERGLSSNTVRAYCIDIRSYLDWAARSDLDPLQVEYRRFRRYLVELNAAGYTPKTTSRRLSAIRTFFKYLNVQGRDPAQSRCRDILAQVGTRPAAQDE